GRAVRDRPRSHLDRRGPAHARQGGGAVRRGPAVRRRGQHGEVSRRRGRVGGGQRLHRLPRWLRVRRGVRRRAQVPRVPPLQDGPGQQQPRARVRRRARARDAEKLLRWGGPTWPPIPPNRLGARASLPIPPTLDVWSTPQIWRAGAGRSYARPAQYRDRTGIRAAVHGARLLRGPVLAWRGERGLRGRSLLWSSAHLGQHGVSWASVFDQLRSVR